MFLYISCMKGQSLLILLFIFSYYFGFGKNYTLTYKPTGKIIQLTFDSCIVYTDSASYFLTIKSFMPMYEDAVVDHINYCKFISAFFKTKDTLKITLTNYSGGSDTLHSPYGFVETAFKLIETNRAKLFAVRGNFFVEQAKITTLKKRRYSWKKFF